MQTFVVLLLFPLLAMATQDDQWSAWKHRYRKVYSGHLEEERARQTWERHSRLVTSHNRLGMSFTLELNQFADTEPRWPTGESTQDLQPVTEVGSSRGLELGIGNQKPPPSSFDWRKKGLVLPVHNQGSMGNSEAEAVTDAAASLHAIKTGKLVSLSVAELVDCCMDQRQFVPNVYECMDRAGGFCSAQDYPTTKGHCRNDTCKAVATDAKETVDVKPGDETQMVLDVLGRPLVVLIDAGHASFQLYKAGIYSDAACKHSIADHAMLLVGYGVDAEGGPYWTLKNSWGSNWGENGYMRIKRGVNMCGVANNVFFPE